MTIHLTPFRLARAFFRAAIGLPPWGGKSYRPVALPKTEATSYVGLFEGVIESASPSPIKPTAKASGFLRLEVDKKKKATGCFMLFADGEVLAGEMEGAAQSGDRLRTASFRLAPDRTRHAAGNHRPTPVTAVGRMRIQTRNHRGVASATESAGEEMTIRFVSEA